MEEKTGSILQEVFALWFAHEVFETMSQY